MRRGDVGEIAMVGDDRRNLDRQRPDAVAVKQVDQTVAEFGNQDQRAGLGTTVVDSRRHGEFARDGGKTVADGLAAGAGFGGEGDA